MLSPILSSTLRSPLCCTSRAHVITLSKTNITSRLLTTTSCLLRQHQHFSTVHSSRGRNAKGLQSRVGRSISSSSVSRSSGQSDVQLLNKLKEEHKFEVESESIKEPDWLGTFKKKSKFSIEEVEGSDEVALVRTFGNESIRIVFSIAEVQQSAHDLENEALPEETEGGGEGESETSESSGVRVAIIVTKPSGGGITFDAIANDNFLIENVSVYDSANLAIDNSHEGDWKRRGLYVGPCFEHLDQELQSSFEDWLEERDINSELAEIVQNLAEYKEQQEYVRWLQQASKFIEA